MGIIQDTCSYFMPVFGLNSGNVNDDGKIYVAGLMIP